MSESWIVRDTDTGEEWTKDSRAEAQEAKQKYASERNLEVVPPGETDGGVEEQVDEDTEVVDMAPDKLDSNVEVPPEPAETDDTYDLPDQPPVDTDPLTWIPDEFQDTIDGTIAINRKGFEVLAHHYDISCETEMVEYGENRVVHKATAKTADGTTYSAYGEAHAETDDESQLVRMSDTRSFKRAVSRATGVGMVAVAELQNEL